LWLWLLLLLLLLMLLLLLDRRIVVARSRVANLYIIHGKL
jgi:hypothetical protein